MVAAQQPSGETVGIRRLALAVRRTQILVGRSRRHPGAPDGHASDVVVRR